MSFLQDPLGLAPAGQHDGKSEKLEEKDGMVNPIANPDPVKSALYITGLGSQYPPFSLRPEQMAGFLQRLKPWTGFETPW